MHTSIHLTFLQSSSPPGLLQFFPTVSNNLSLLRLCGKHEILHLSLPLLASCVRSSVAVAVALARNLAATTEKELTIDSPELSTRAIPHFIALLSSPLLTHESLQP
jgi:hypothetical protein